MLPSASLLLQHILHPRAAKPTTPHIPLPAPDPEPMSRNAESQPLSFAALPCSQPPLLSQMVRTVYNATRDESLLVAAWEPLLQEHAYWTSDPKVITVSLPEGGQYNFSRYYAEWDMPRPESYLCAAPPWMVVTAMLLSV